ncbi:sodium:solute symporter family transporter, partial [Staphylococcus epidermidis]
MIKIVSPFIILLFFTLYTHSPFLSPPKLFQTPFPLNYHPPLFIVTIILIFYTFFPPYLALSITHFFQRLIILIPILMLPILPFLKLNPCHTFHHIPQIKPTNLHLFTPTTLLPILSLFSSPLPYFPQPLIILSF